MHKINHSEKQNRFKITYLKNHHTQTIVDDATQSKTLVFLDSKIK
jgi:hypothetical protein